MAGLLQTRWPEPHTFIRALIPPLARAMSLPQLLVQSKSDFANDTQARGDFSTRRDAFMREQACGSQRTLAIVRCRGHGLSDPEAHCTWARPLIIPCTRELIAGSSPRVQLDEQDGEWDDPDLTVLENLSNRCDVKKLPPPNAPLVSITMWNKSVLDGFMRGHDNNCKAYDVEAGAPARRRQKAGAARSEAKRLDPAVRQAMPDMEARIEALERTVMELSRGSRAPPQPHTSQPTRKRTRDGESTSEREDERNRDSDEGEYYRRSGWAQAAARSTANGRISYAEQRRAFQASDRRHGRPYRDM